MQEELAPAKTMGKGAVRSVGKCSLKRGDGRGRGGGPEGENV